MNTRAKWLAARSVESLPVTYFHVVFTLLYEFSALAFQNKRPLYDLLYRTSAATMLELARDLKQLCADIGLLGVRRSRVERGPVTVSAEVGSRPAQGDASSFLVPSNAPLIPICCNPRGARFACHSREKIELISTSNLQL